MQPASTPFTPIAKKLGPMIRLLNSPIDGEVIGAARGIMRILRAAGLDEHALADAVEDLAYRKFSEEDALEIFQRGVAKGKQDESLARPQSNGFHTVGHPPSAMNDIAVECQERRRKRNAQEEEFVEHMVELTANGGVLSEKQEAWLRSIYGRRPI